MKNQNLNILIVEDNEDNYNDIYLFLLNLLPNSNIYPENEEYFCKFRHSFRISLKREGSEAMLVEAQKKIDEVNMIKYDLILLDYILFKQTYAGTVNGFQFFKKFIQDKTVSVIGISSDDEYNRKFLELNSLFGTQVELINKAYFRTKKLGEENISLLKDGKEYCSVREESYLYVKNKLTNLLHLDL